MTDDRSERLRRRRKRSTAQTTAGGHAPESISDQASATQSGKNDKEASVKERQTGTYMYLPDGQVKDLRRVYNVLKAEYEYEYDESFEKNRHFYPLVVQLGLDQLQDMDAATVRDRLEDLS